MNKKQFSRLSYTAPQCRIVQTESEGFICASINPGGNTPGYDNRGEHNVGTIEFGDASTTAPAKVGEFDNNGVE